VSDLNVRTLNGGGRWCRRRMRGADRDERRRRMNDIPTGKLGPAGSQISFVYIEVPYSCTNKLSNQSSILFDMQNRCPTKKPLHIQGLARNGLMRLIRNSDLWLKTQPGTTSGGKTFQPASRPLAPSGSSRPRSCQEVAFSIRSGLLSEVLNSRCGSTSMQLSLWLQSCKAYV